MNGKLVGVLYLDLDRFKFVNDKFGHDIGDELLVLVAKRLNQCIRDSDTMSRIGGDEFTAFLPSMSSPEDAKLVADKFIKTLSNPFSVRNYQLDISVSIGIAVYPQDGLDIEVLLKNADTAMYHAKNAGRNNFKFYVPSMKPEYA